MKNRKIMTLAIRRRKYAPFFEWPDKKIKELGVAQELIKALPRHGLVWANARVRHPDPPDCVCIDNDGNLVAVEVVELVSQEAVERNQRDEKVLCCWSWEDIRAGIGSLLSAKDVKTFSGGPYAEIAVLIHTDEPLMTVQDAQTALAEYTFGPFRNVTKAFLMFSYEPEKGYQVLAIPLATSSKT